MKTVKQWYPEFVNAACGEPLAALITAAQIDAVKAAWMVARDLCEARFQSFCETRDHFKKQSGCEDDVEATDLAAGAFKKFRDRLMEAQVDMEFDLKDSGAAISGESRDRPTPEVDNGISASRTVDSQVQSLPAPPVTPHATKPQIVHVHGDDWHIQVPVCRYDTPKVVAESIEVRLRAQGLPR